MFIMPQTDLAASGLMWILICYHQQKAHSVWS